MSFNRCEKNESLYVKRTRCSRGIAAWVFGRYGNGMLFIFCSSSIWSLPSGLNRTGAALLNTIKYQPSTPNTTANTIARAYLGCLTYLRGVFFLLPFFWLFISCR